GGQRFVQQQVVGRRRSALDLHRVLEQQRDHRHVVDDDFRTEGDGRERGGDGTVHLSRLHSPLDRNGPTSVWHADGNAPPRDLIFAYEVVPPPLPLLDL